MLTERTTQNKNSEIKTVGIVGLGLIGGSFAKAYHGCGWRVFAYDLDEDTMAVSMIDDVVQAYLDSSTIGQCDLIILAVYPAACISWLSDNAHLISRDALVIDTCGVKREVCRTCMPLAARFGLTFVGAHPMAGTQYSGYRYSRPNLFHNAPMVICPPCLDDMELFERISQALEPAGFGSIQVSSPDEHDKRIAFTSQLAHVVSNAYIKSPTAQGHKGFSAGSYKDLTRVARLNENMWSELFCDNVDNLLFELDTLIASLQQYSAALATLDREELKNLLAQGRRAKEDAERR